MDLCTCSSILLLVSLKENPMGRVKNVRVRYVKTHGGGREGTRENTDVLSYTFTNVVTLSQNEKKKYFFHGWGRLDRWI